MDILQFNDETCHIPQLFSRTKTADLLKPTSIIINMAPMWVRLRRALQGETGAGGGKLEHKKAWGVGACGGHPSIDCQGGPREYKKFQKLCIGEIPSGVFKVFWGSFWVKEKEQCIIF